MTAARKPNPLAGAIAAVQTCRRKVDGLADDEAWRNLLERLTDKRSLREMNGPQLGAVLDELHRLGAPRRPGAGAGRSRLADDPQSKMIRALWLQLHQAGHVRLSNESALCGWMSRQLGREVADLRFMDSHERSEIIEALKQWCRRKGVEIHD